MDIPLHKIVSHYVDSGNFLIRVYSLTRDLPSFLGEQLQTPYPIAVRQIT